MRRGMLQKKKNDEVIFSLAWNIMFTDNQKVVVLNFLEIKNMLFLSQKVDGKMIFSDYWKFFLLVVSRIGYTVIFWAIKLMERRYLLITEKLFVLNFSVMGIRSFFESRSWWKDDIYCLLRSCCFELFGDGKYGLFFQPKYWWKDDIYLKFLSFKWYSRTWEIWFLVQCHY